MKLTTEDASKPRLKGFFALLVLLLIGFILASNYFGWEARGVIKKIEKICDADKCYHRAYVNNSGMFFNTTEDVKVGDFIDFSVKCELDGLCRASVKQIIFSSRDQEQKSR